MFIYGRKIIAAIAAVCAAAAITTACGKDKTEELSSSSAPEVLEEVTTEEADEEETTAAEEAATKAVTTSAQATAEAATEVEPEIEKVETPSTGESEISITIDPTMGQEQTTQTPIVQQPVVDTPAYNQDIKDKLGVEVVLTGTNEQQAQQYVDACKAAYPSLPWVNSGTWAGIDVWSLTADELDALINERLAGRDYHDLSIEELYALQDLTEGLSPLADEIGAYFNDLTSKDFNNGGYVIAE